MCFFWDAFKAEVSLKNIKGKALFLSHTIAASHQRIFAFVIPGIKSILQYLSSNVYSCSAFFPLFSFSANLLLLCDTRMLLKMRKHLSKLCSLSRLFAPYITSSWLFVSHTSRSRHLSNSISSPINRNVFCLVQKSWCLFLSEGFIFCSTAFIFLFHFVLTFDFSLF